MILNLLERIDTLEKLLKAMETLPRKMYMQTKFYRHFQGVAALASYHNCGSPSTDVPHRRPKPD